MPGVGIESTEEPQGKRMSNEKCGYSVLLNEILAGSEGRKGHNLWLSFAWNGLAGPVTSSERGKVGLGVAGPCLPSAHRLILVPSLALVGPFGCRSSLSCGRVVLVNEEQQQNPTACPSALEVTATISKRPLLHCLCKQYLLYLPCRSKIRPS